MNEQKVNAAQSDSEQESRTSLERIAVASGQFYENVITLSLTPDNQDSFLSQAESLLGALPSSSLRALFTKGVEKLAAKLEKNHDLLLGIPDHTDPRSLLKATFQSEGINPNLIEEAIAKAEPDLLKLDEPQPGVVVLECDYRLYDFLE